MQPAEFPQKPTEALPAAASQPHPPEMQARIDEFNRKLGDALVKNLNARVMAENKPE